MYTRLRHGPGQNTAISGDVTRNRELPSMTGVHAEALRASLPSNLDFQQLATVLAVSGRPVLLQHLKDAGMSSLPERQRLATLVARVSRELASPLRPPPPLLHQPSKPPLAIRAEAGLCNKLRVVLSYREVCIRGVHAGSNPPFFPC